MTDTAPVPPAQTGPTADADLLALVSAPPIEAATVRHVDVIQLQVNVVVVAVITLPTLWLI